MPQSLARVLVHLVFSTKHRVPVLAPEIRTALHPYLSVVLNNDGCTSLRVGGVEDHVHLFFGLSRTRTISQVVENVKTSSSKWLKAKWPALADFQMTPRGEALRASRPLSSFTPSLTLRVRRESAFLSYYTIVPY